MKGNQQKSRKWLKLGITILVIWVAACGSMVYYVQQYKDRDIPNPAWGTFNGGYTYTPQQVPPGPGLLNSRPEDILLQYFHDYNMVYGTIPCAQPISSDAEDIMDQVRVPNIGQTMQCANTRKVQSIQIQKIHVYFVGGIAANYDFVADVYFVITYQDGTQWQGDYPLAPDFSWSQIYYRTYIHLDCWTGYSNYLDLYGIYFEEYNLKKPTTKGMEYDWGSETICNP